MLIFSRGNYFLPWESRAPVSVLTTFLSWEVTGILRVVYHSVPRQPVNIDCVPKVEAQPSEEQSCADCSEPDPQFSCPICQHILCEDVVETTTFSVMECDTLSHSKTSGLSHSLEWLYLAFAPA